jgi:ParB family transcriptional regulator, chromosome partitioning protein
MELVKRKDSFEVPHSRLRLDPANAESRHDLGDLDQLEESIKENGVLEAVSAYKQKDPTDGEDYYYLTNGRRRFLAAGQLKEKTGVEIYFPVLTKKKVNDELATIERLLRNEGKAYTPYEICLEIQKLINWKWSERDIAKKLGRSENHIKNLLSLANAPKEVQNLVAGGHVSATLAIHQIAKGDTAVNQLVEKANEAPVHGPQQANLLDDGAKPTKEKKPRVTAKDLAPELNSWKEYKSWAKSANEANMSATAVAFHKFLLKIINNEVGEKDFNQFFFRSND